MRKPGFPGYYYFGNVAGMSKPKIEERGERGEKWAIFGKILYCTGMASDAVTETRLCKRSCRVCQFCTFPIFPFSDFDMNHFWNWTHFNDYLKAIILFSLFGCIITFCFANYPVYLETLGFVSVFTEAMLGAPQFYRNFKNKSTTGMR